MEGQMQHTLAMIKPDAAGRSDEIEKIILNNGFTIVEVGNEEYLCYFNLDFF